MRMSRSPAGFAYRVHAILTSPLKVASSFELIGLEVERHLIDTIGAGRMSARCQQQMQPG